MLSPAHITLGQLHHVVQMVAGWTDEHLHQFTLPPSRSALNHAQGASANMNKGPRRSPCQ
ncbi:IS1096 element passenger TnpR family protein [Cupriavidus sp. SK-3]|uniref:IS1096 element passenger TnpR family protein n=1 Tax=Cupriavidus sp. SK-3 TaxID=1470558 RepID=UPI0012678B67